MLNELLVQIWLTKKYSHRQIECLMLGQPCPTDEQVPHRTKDRFTAADTSVLPYAREILFKVVHS